MLLELHVSREGLLRVDVRALSVQSRVRALALNKLDISKSTRIRRPRALSSVLAALGTLQPRVLGLLIRVDFIDSLSNYIRHSGMWAGLRGAIAEFPSFSLRARLTQQKPGVGVNTVPPDTIH